MRFLIDAANATVAIEDGMIVDASGSFDHVIRAPQGHVYSGLINAHDHLHRNHYGRLGTPPYGNAYEWANDIQARHAAEIARGRRVPRRKALLFGAWKNLLSGVTHVVHHDPWEPDFADNFPLDVIRIASADSLGMTSELGLPRTGPFALHVAEGTDGSAAEEIQTLARRGVLSSDFLAVHAVGPDADGIARLRASGAAIVLCPTSNRFLFGRTPPAALLEEGIDVLIGSDSLLTGSGTLLDEIAAARDLISDARIAEAVGTAAARRLGIAEPSLAHGVAADLVLFRTPLCHASLESTMLVMAGGRIRVLEPDIAAAMKASGGRTVEWRGVRRWISSC